MENLIIFGVLVTIIVLLLFILGINSITINASVSIGVLAIIFLIKHIYKSQHNISEGA